MSWVWQYAVQSLGGWGWSGGWGNHWDGDADNANQRSGAWDDQQGNANQGSWGNATQWSGGWGVANQWTAGWGMANQRGAWQRDAAGYGSSEGWGDAGYEPDEEWDWNDEPQGEDSAWWQAQLLQPSPPPPPSAPPSQHDANHGRSTAKLCSMVCSGVIDGSATGSGGGGTRQVHDPYEGWGVVDPPPPPPPLPPPSAKPPASQDARETDPGWFARRDAAKTASAWLNAAKTTGVANAPATAPQPLRANVPAAAAARAQTAALRARSTPGGSSNDPFQAAGIRRPGAIQGWNPAAFGVPRGSGSTNPADIGYTDAFRCPPLKNTVLCLYHQAGTCRRGRQQQKRRDCSGQQLQQQQQQQMQQQQQQQQIGNSRMSTVNASVRSSPHANHDSIPRPVLRLLRVI